MQDSPLEPLITEAREEGYPVDSSAQGRRPYQGYYFRILTGQGPNAPDGARNYISNGRMTSGFALIAWPASYGVSGLMSFAVNQDGIVFQKDLGPQTAASAAASRWWIEQPNASRRGSTMRFISASSELVNFRRRRSVPGKDSFL